MSRRPGFLALFFGFLFLFGLALVAFGIYFVGFGHEAASWPSVEGQVAETRIQIDSSVNHTTAVRRESRERHRRYYPRITYRWNVDGESHVGSRYRLGTTFRKFKTRKEAQEAARAFPRGRTIPVHYDPDDPSEAVLEKAVSFSVYVPLIMGLFFFVCGGLGFRHREALEAAAAKGAPRNTATAGNTGDAT